MGDQYVDPFEAFKRKKKEAESKEKGNLSRQNGQAALPEVERPTGFTTNRYDRKKFMPPPQSPAPADQPGEQDFFPEDAGDLPVGEKPRGFVTHHHKAKKPPKPDELKRPKGFKSHRWD